MVYGIWCFICTSLYLIDQQVVFCLYSYHYKLLVGLGTCSSKKIIKGSYFDPTHVNMARGSFSKIKSNSLKFMQTFLRFNAATTITYDERHGFLASGCSGLFTIFLGVPHQSIRSLCWQRKERTEMIMYRSTIIPSFIALRLPIRLLLIFSSAIAMAWKVNISMN